MSLYTNARIAEPSNETLSSSSEKKVLYFSDGTLEVDELDGESPVNSDSKSSAVNPQELTWIPWMWYQTIMAGSKALEVCDYMGESLASFFGITTPKYQFELNEYYRLKKEEEEEMKNDLEMGDWARKFSGDEENRTIETGPKACDRNTELT